MSQPWGFDDRDKPGLRGLLARWWYRRRSRIVREQLAKLRRLDRGTDT